MKTTDAITDFFIAKPDLSQRAIEQYEFALNKLSVAIPEMPGTKEDIRCLLRQAHTPWIRLSLWNVYNIFYHWCHLEYDFVNPMEKVEKPKIPDVEIKALEPMELSVLMAAAESLQEKLILSLALDCGLRASEFGRIRIMDVHSEYVWITGKRNKRARVPFCPETYYMLQQWITGLPDQNSERIIFLNTRKKPMTRYNVYDLVRKCMDRAGIQGSKRGPHCLRHSLGMNYIASGGEPFSLKRIMRHSNISTTNKYVNLSLNKVIESHNQHSPLHMALQGAQGVLIKKELLIEAESIIKV